MSSWYFSFSDDADSYRPKQGTPDDLSEAIESAFAHKPLSSHLESERAILEKQVDEDLREAVEWARENGDTVPSEAAVRTCKRVAARVIPHVLGLEGTRIAAFDDGDGELSLVLQPVGARRRLTYEVSADGREVVQVKTDEQLRVERCRVSITDVASTAESVRWLIGQP